MSIPLERYDDECSVCVAQGHAESAHWHTEAEHVAAGGAEVAWVGVNRPFGRFYGIAGCGQSHTYARDEQP
jgi:hypothetical protein